MTWQIHIRRRVLDEAPSRIDNGIARSFVVPGRLWGDSQPERA